ncbi:MAG: PIN domain-containing protein [Bacteroidota bacterium]
MAQDVVCIDANVLVWGIKSQSSKGQEDKISQARAFLEKLDTEQKKVIVPAPVIGEILVRCTNEERKKFLKEIASRFRIVPFDTQAAVTFSATFKQTLEDQIAKEHRKRYQTPRGKMKFDLQIISIALVQGASVIYSNDPDISTFAGTLIPVKGIPFTSEED